MAKIKVFLHDGVVTDVLTTDQNIEVEVVDIDKDYEDADQLRDYEDKLYQDESLKSARWSTARFTEDNAADTEP